MVSGTAIRRFADASKYFNSTKLPMSSGSVDNLLSLAFNVFKCVKQPMPLTVVSFLFRQLMGGIPGGRPPEPSCDRTVHGAGPPRTPPIKGRTH